MTRERLADWTPAAGVLLLHLAFLPGYGVFRDELYYMACARRLAWGYVDHPPLVAWVAWLVARVAGESHLALRVVAALAAGATVFLSGRTAGALGGGAFARGLAGTATALAPVVLGVCSTYSMNPLDLLLWALVALVLVRVLSGGPERLWLAFGALAGLGLLNKISLLYLGFGLALGLLLARRDVLRSRWFWAGGALALLLFLPHVAWQQAHGWPTLEFMANARAHKMKGLSPLGFLLGTVEQTAFVAWLWIAGIGWLLLARTAARVRPLGFALLAVVAVLALAGGKPYYLAAAYALAFAAGAVAVEQWTAARARRLRPLLVAAIVAAGLALAPLARPVLPTEAYVRYAAALGQQPGSDERHALGRLPQYYADMHGWREWAGSIAAAVRTLPAEERARACVFGTNYGEAGAVEYFARALALPPAISSHNNYFLWGAGACGEVLVVATDREARLRELFASIERAGTTRCGDCMPYENDKPIWIARRPRQPLPAVWPQLKNYN